MLSCNYNQTIFSAETFVHKQQGAVMHYWLWSSWKKFKTSSYKLHFGHGLLIHAGFAGTSSPSSNAAPGYKAASLPHFFSTPFLFPILTEEVSWRTSATQLGFLTPHPHWDPIRGTSTVCSPGASSPRSLNSAHSWWRWREASVRWEALSLPPPKPGMGCSFDETCAWSYWATASPSFFSQGYAATGAFCCLLSFCSVSGLPQLRQKIIRGENEFSSYPMCCVSVFGVCFFFSV